MSEKREGKQLLEFREEKKESKWTPKRKKEIRGWVLAILGAVLTAFLIRTFLFTMIRVDGHSMLETLQDGDRVFVTILDVKLGGVDRGDVVICHYPNRGWTYFVKRVIGLAGDTVEIKDKVTYLNGEPLDEPFVVYPDDADFGPFTVPEGKVFVMGDNRDNSSDSRFVGALDENMIVGRVRLRWWPFSAFGKVE